MLFSGCLAEAKISVELNRNNSASSYANGASLGASGDLQSLGYNYSFSHSVANLNPNLSDFTIESVTHDLSYQINFPSWLKLDFNGSQTKYNQDEAQTLQYSAGAYIKFLGVQFGFSSSTSKTEQLQDIIILNRNYKDETHFQQKSATYYMDIQWSENLLATLKYTYYAYDENLNAFNNIGTTQVFLNRAGPSFVNEVQTQLKNATELDLAYTLDDNWLLQFGGGQTQDYLYPSDRTSEAHLGFDYEVDANDVTYKFFYTVNGTKNLGDTSVSYSHFFGLGIEF